MIRRVNILAFILFTFSNIAGQDLSNQRIRNFSIADSVVIDTLSIVPGSITILPYVDTTCYKVNFAKAIIYFRCNLLELPQQVRIEYRVFPYLFEREFYIRDYQASLSPDSLLGRFEPRYDSGLRDAEMLGDNIRTSGSFTRGIGFGNNQDLSVTSGMNLRLSGEIGSGLMIEGAISDQNIPLQPQGNTRRLEEFDRVYMKVYRENLMIQAGDIDMYNRKNNSLLAYSRRVQGLTYSSNLKTKNESDTLSVEATASVAKGKFARNQIQGIEGNQGPYRLKGTFGEPFIVVISGSERVFVDGVLLARGEDAQYTIDYNLAEVTFMPRVMVNNFSRIVVEFEYSDRNYARFTTHAGVEQMGKKWDWRFGAFSEMDAKNQPYDQDLTDEQKRLLASIGDRTELAFIPQVDSVEFSAEIILYQKVDTTVNGIFYSVYRYSTNPMLANFRVYFTYVGEGKGNYVTDFGSANGRVYRWVAPVNGMPTGNYEPIRRLVAPSKSQMVTGGFGRKWGKDSGIQLDYALSNTDLNTFSSLNSDDNVGQAIKSSFVQRFQKSDASPIISLGAEILKTSSEFRSIDRFRDVEFERNWSLSSPLNGGGEQQLGTWLEVLIPQKGFARANFDVLSLKSGFNGEKIGVKGWQKISGLKVGWDGFWVNASDSVVKNDFKKAKISIEKSIWLVNLTLSSEAEDRRSQSVQTDSLLANSFQWYSFKALASSPDTLPQRVSTSYTYRTDYLPQKGQMKIGSESHEIMASGVVDNQKIGNASISAGYRIFNPFVSGLGVSQPEERTFIGQLQYSKRFWKGAWMLSTSYELGSGLEPENEYYFVEVPAGQGLYAWVDYNQNGVKEIDEFEIARFSDEAKYIRINFPGSKMVRVKSNGFSFRSNINPRMVSKADGIPHKLLRHLSNQTAYLLKQKNRFEDFWHSANPFTENINDTLITSSSASFRNSLAINRNSQTIGAEYLLTQTKSKSLLANGFENRDANAHRLITWVGLGKSIIVKAEGEIFENSAISQFFETRNYTINGVEPLLKVRFMGVKNLTIESTYKWTSSENIKGNEKATIQTITLQTDYVFPGKGSVTASASLVKNDFSGKTDTPVAYEMLRGLQPGQNIIWELMARQRLSKNLELELGYGARKLNNGKVIHTGSMQARALF